MSLSNAIVKTGSTIATTGGSDLTFTPFGVSGNTAKIGVPADTDFRLRRMIDFKVNQPLLNPTSPNGYTQAKASALFTKPKLLANGKYTKNTIQISIFYDPETTDAEKTELLDVAAQMCFDADFTDFFKSLSLA
jgi:hypothetical protein